MHEGIKSYDIMNMRPQNDQTLCKVLDQLPDPIFRSQP